MSMSEERFLTDQMARGLHATSALLSEIQVSITTLKSEQSAIKEDVEDLLTIVRDGNGKDPLTTRMIILEKNYISNYEKIESQVKEIKEDLNKIEVQKQHQTQQLFDKGWAVTMILITAIITSGVGFTASSIFNTIKNPDQSTKIINNK